MSYIEYLDHTTKTIPPQKAQQLRDAWVMRDSQALTAEQRAFLDKISKIHHTTEEVYCLHRFTLDKIIPGFRGSRFYLMKCPQCNEQLATDQRPAEN